MAPGWALQVAVSVEGRYGERLEKIEAEGGSVESNSAAAGDTLADCDTVAAATY